MEYAELMKSFGAEVGIADLAPDSEGVCALEVDGMKVSFMELPESGQLATWAPVGDLPPEGRERLYRVFIEAMYMGQATGGSVLSIAPNSDTVHLHRIDSLMLTDLDSFKAMLEKFVNVLEQWRKIVSGYSEAAPRIASDEAAATEEARQFGLGGFLQV